MINEHLGDVPRRVADATSAGIVVGAIFHVLPSIAVLLSILYTLIQLYESKTGQRAIAWGLGLFRPSPAGVSLDADQDGVEP